MNKAAAHEAAISVAAYSAGFSDGAKRGSRAVKKTEKRLEKLQGFYREAIIEVAGTDAYRQISVKIASKMSAAYAEESGDNSLGALVEMMKVIDTAVRETLQRDRDPDAKQDTNGSLPDFDLPDDHQDADELRQMLESEPAQG